MYNFKFLPVDTEVAVAEAAMPKIIQVTRRKHDVSDVIMTVLLLLSSIIFLTDGDDDEEVAVDSILLEQELLLLW